MSEHLPAKVEMGERGLVPTDIDGLYRMAKAVQASGLAPRGLDSAEKIFVAFQTGMEVGLTPMQALKNIAVINGRASMWGDAMMAVARNHPQCEWMRETIEGDGDLAVATCTIKRTDSPEPESRTFSVKDAKVAKLWGKQGPWQTNPKRMLQMRARSFAIRDILPEAVCGLQMAEEVADIPPHQPANRPTAPQGAPDALLERLSPQKVETPAEPESPSEAPPEPSEDVIEGEVVEEKVEW